MGQSEADIALQKWLFGFRPCSGQGQFTLPTYVVQDQGRLKLITSQSITTRNHTPTW